MGSEMCIRDRLTHDSKVSIDVKVSLSHIPSYAVAFAMIEIQEAGSREN